MLGCAVDNDYPQNIILFIGDGMGVGHITAGKIARGNMNLERFSVMGLVTTHSANQLITESAAAATALATGYETNNRAISVSVDKEPLKTLFEYAKEEGKSLGVVVTSSVTHATPAAFMAHADDRRQHADAAMIDFDDAVGAGLDFAQKNRRTLIVVTADHETGGMAVHGGSVQNMQLDSTAFTTTGHTAAMVPLFAYGPGSTRFSGIQDNARVGQALIGLLLKKKIKN